MKMKDGDRRVCAEDGDRELEVVLIRNGSQWRVEAPNGVRTPAKVV
jgi:hypothetical protein